LDPQRRYDLEKVEGEPARVDMMRMLQTLVADRFPLRLHAETREVAAPVLSDAPAEHDLVIDCYSASWNRTVGVFSTV
jgi:hypothetical protein